ncbi:MAG TPA: hypothetical protein VL197_13060 [Nitrospirota bacterium]|nr:hypothetical protein [Nitrospirota bacterium]
MKKFVVLFVVVALTCFSAVAFAADVTVGGSLEIRSRDFTNLNVVPDSFGNSTSADSTYRDTQSRIRIDVNAKAGDVKGKIELEQDFNTGGNDWGTGNDVLSNKVPGGVGYSNSTANGNLGFREAWISFNLPGIPVNVTGGHQLLALGNAWFFKSMHYGSEAWVVANQTGPNTFAFVNVKVLEGSINAADDIDAYALLDVFKISDAATVGIDLTNILDRKSLSPLPPNPVPNGTVGRDSLYNLGLNMNGKFGPVALKAEIDQQFGKAKAANLVTVGGIPSGDAKFKGNEIVVQGNVGLDPVTINFTAARGTGAKDQQTDINQFVNFLDIDPHYTFLYEYKVVTAAGAKNTGFSNTEALSAGVSAAVTKSLVLGVDLWYLLATQAVAINGATVFGSTLPATSHKVGTEVDVKANWQIAENLSWNWLLGYFAPGDAYDKNVNGVATKGDKVTGIQGVLAFKF